MRKYTAVIIKGNPKFTNNNPDASNFYQEIKEFLEELGYKVSFDEGRPYTTPKDANLWIGHSRGVDRLKFAPGGVYTLKFASPDEDSVNHPSDNTVANWSLGIDITPNEFHYKFTDKMKEAILIATSKMRM